MDNFTIIDDNFKIISEISVPLGEDEPSKRLLRLCCTSDKDKFAARYHFVKSSGASCTFNDEIDITSKDIEDTLNNHPIEKVKAPDVGTRNLEIPSVKVVIDLMFASCLVFSKGGFSFLDFNAFLHYYFGYYRDNFKIDNAKDRLTIIYKGKRHTVSLSKFKDRLSTFFVGFIRDYYAICLLKECNWYERVMMSTKLDISYGVDILVKLNDGKLVGIDNSYDKHSLFTKFKDNPNATELNDYAYGCIKEIEYMGKIEKIPVILFNIYYSGDITCGGVYLPNSKYAQNVDDSINKYLDILRGEK